jgi:hypothetical protein
MLPVFGGISGSTRTTLNINSSSSAHLAPGIKVDEAEVEEEPSHFARDEFLELHNVDGEFADAFGCFLRRHCVLI